MNTKYLKWLNLIPIIMYAVVDQLRGTLLSRILLLAIILLGVMNVCIAKGMKDYLFSSLILFLSTMAGIALYSLYYYYFISSDFETPIVAILLMALYGIFAFVVAAVGSIGVVIKDRKHSV